MTLDIDAIRQALAAFDNNGVWLSDDGSDIPALVANAPVWLASLCDRVEDLNEANEIDKDTLLKLVAERDAALAECERLRNETWALEAVTEAYRHESLQLGAWRACADQLAARLQIETRHSALTEATADALAAYESLKGAS